MRHTPSPLMQPADTYALRGLCMIMIIVHHTWLSAAADSECHIAPWMGSLGISWTWGYAATGLFLLVSGFGMYFSLERNRPIGRTYVASKLLKILKPWLFLWLLCLAIYAVADNALLTPRLLTAFVSMDIPPDNEAWFLKTITLLYIASMAVFRLVRNPRACVAVLSCLCVAYYLAAHYIFGMQLWWFITVLNYPLGMIMATFYHRLRDVPAWPVALACTAAFALLQWLHPNPTLSSLLFSVAAVNVVRIVDINCRALRYIGRNSIMFYLLEVPAIDYLSRFAHADFVLYSLSAIAITVVLTALCKCATERDHKN